jgi:hypothetical protein
VVHCYCHDQRHGAYGRSHIVEEPCEAKTSSPVLKTSRTGGRPAWCNRFAKASRNWNKG